MNFRSKRRAQGILLFLKSSLLLFIKKTKTIDYFKTFTSIIELEVIILLLLSVTERILSDIKRVLLHPILKANIN